MESRDPHAHPMWDAERQRRFGEFICRVSPGADPASVMLFGQILHANNQLVQAAERNLATVGLSWAKFRLLMNLQRQERHGEGEGMQPSELSEMQGISRNTVSALINSLEEEELIEREIHGTDRRKFLIRLTPKGRRTVRAKLDDEFMLVSHCFDGLTPQERKAFLGYVAKLNRSLAAKAKAAACPHH